MRLPNGERAIVDIRKLREYCLNPLHLRGHNKARAYAMAALKAEQLMRLHYEPTHKAA
jgi:hypothetical protein